MIPKWIKNSGSDRLAFLILLTLILIAGFIRARINFSSGLIPGINGGYYPLLVRNLLEYGSIRYPDTQLIYWIQAPLSLLTRLLTGLSTDQSILLSTRIFDSFIPPLTCIPVFLFARHHLRGQVLAMPFSIVIAAFSVLYLAFLLVLTAEMQKNATGMIWLAGFIWSVTRIQPDSSRKYLLISAVFLILTALTHIGCFAVEFLFILIYSASSIARLKGKIRKKTVMIVLSAILGLVLVSFVILSRDPDRLARVISFYLNPLRLFESPCLLILLSGQQTYFGFLFHKFLLMNVLSLAGLIILLLNRTNISFFDFTCGLSLLLLSLLLCSPLLGIEWALRYYLMAFLPLSMASVFIFKSLKMKIQKLALLAVFLVITGFSLTIALTAKRNPVMSSTAYKDLASLKLETNINPDDLVIARHGLEWWTGWVMRCRTGKEYCLKPADWDKYPAIYLLRQFEGNNFPAQQGTGQFAEFPIPASAKKVSSNQSFVLYKLERPTDTENYPGELPLLQGVIKSISPTEIFIRSEGFVQPVRISPDTKFNGRTPTGIRDGMKADVWGKRLPFSLKIKADEIKAY